MSGENGHVAMFRAVLKAVRLCYAGTDGTLHEHMDMYVTMLKAGHSRDVRTERHCIDI